MRRTTKKTKKQLELKTATLRRLDPVRELTPEELARVGGGSDFYCYSVAWTCSSG